ncbi:TonB-dependent receptor [Methylohalobius crimeensis]|uniref:TonB-dependent receptor n=1 Tax=Methylohalobius crimeensis TaxID=244365 RepID=UPI0003B73060|nr:TonB-dependent receptor [Methylohalobius crimeensis]
MLIIDMFLTRRILGILTIMALGASPIVAQENENEKEVLDKVVVSATRTETPISEISRSVTVVTKEEIAKQARLSRNLSSILANTVPGLGPSTEAVSNFGQDLRGRNFLVLIDGVPQSTPLRDGFRDLNTIEPSSIEQIEVLRGGTAVYGFGASGGLINIITKKPSSQTIEAYSQAGVRFSTEHFEDSQTYETTHRLSGTTDNFEYLLSGTFVNRNGQFDANGRRIPPNPLGSQGGFSDSNEYDLLGKLGYAFDGDRQRFDLMVNHLNNQQNTDYIFGAEPFTTAEDPTPNSRRTPAIPIDSALSGSTNIIDPGTENTVVSASYTNRNLLGSSLNLQAYYGDQSATFPRFPGFNQGQINSEKIGTRLTIDTPIEVYNYNFNAIWGVDYINDQTVQDEFGEGTSNAVPNMELNAIAGFLEGNLPLGSIGLLRGGLRHEQIWVDTDTVALNRFQNTVLGGNLEFSETVYNASAVFFLTDSLDLFASFSQGFSVADIGRVISNAGPFGAGATFNAKQFESEAEKVNNYELGLRGRTGELKYSVVGFFSESDNGSTFDTNLAIQKFAERIWGVEASLDYSAFHNLDIGGTFSWAEGERDSEAGGTVDLDNTRISPIKLTAYLDYRPLSWWDNRLQLLYVGDRNPDTGTTTGFANGNVNGYALVDIISRFKVGPGHLQISARNLLNNDYFPAVNQAFNINSAFAKGPGRTVGISYELNWL